MDLSQADINRIADALYLRMQQKEAARQDATYLVQLAKEGRWDEIKDLTGGKRK